MTHLSSNKMGVLKPQLSQKVSISLNPFIFIFDVTVILLEIDRNSFSLFYFQRLLFFFVGLLPWTQKMFFARQSHKFQ